MQTERRRYVRYIPQDNAFAALGKRFTKTGKIKNISMDGLCFEYIVSLRTTSTDTASVEIFLIDKPFHIHGLPCRLVYDYEVSSTPAPIQSGEFYLPTVAECVFSPSLICMTVFLKI
jgi:hypothetical protein